MNSLKKIFPVRHPLRLAYHKLKGICAAVLYGFPANKLKVVGVTGTNGKTTSVNLIAHILESAGKKVGLVSTVNFRINGKETKNNTKMSSQSPFALQRMLKRMVKEGCEYAILEVTSHAMDQHRVWGVSFDTALFTNLTHDHLDYHGSFEEYRRAKGKLFEAVSRGKRKKGVKKSIVLNADDGEKDYFNQFVSDLKMTYGFKQATVYPEAVKMSPEGTDFVLHVPNNALNVRLRIPGEYNVYNAMGSVAVCLALNVDLQQIKKGLESFRGVDGRFEDVNFGQDYSVVVDYAHNPDSLENLLQLYKKLTSGRLFLVFGATGGGRDTSKRPIMGELADKYADVIFLTDDDPYEEDEYEIIDMVAKGIKRKEGEGFWMIPDRREAIRTALTHAEKGDTVLVAGKGAEEVMMIHGKRVDWNDKKVIKSILERDVEVEIGEDEIVRVV